MQLSKIFRREFTVLSYQTGLEIIEEEEEGVKHNYYSPYSVGFKNSGVYAKKKNVGVLVIYKLYG